MHILKNQYTYYHYHWLWGMQYTPQAPSYYIKQQMEDYLLYPQQLIQHIDQIKKIQEKPLWLRGIYWLFNIEQYAERSQKLSMFYLEAEQTNELPILYLFTPLKGGIFMEHLHNFMSRFSTLPSINAPSLFNDCWPTQSAQSHQNAELTTVDQMQTNI